MYLILLILWFIFSGKVTLEIFLFGLVICGWLYWFMTKHMDYSIQKDLKLITKFPWLHQIWHHSGLGSDQVQSGCHPHHSFSRAGS